MQTLPLASRELHEVRPRPEVTSALPLTGLGFALLWIAAWNLMAPIRFAGIIENPFSIRPDALPSLGVLFMDQTSWALATLLAFGVGRRVRERPRGAMLARFALLAVTIVAARYWLTFWLVGWLGWGAAPTLRQLLVSGPFHFVIVTALGATGVLAQYVQRTREQAVANARLQGQLAEARLEALRLQLNPHFLFNALNTIASLVHSDAAKADTALAALSSFLRGSLGSGRGDLVTMEDDLRLLDAYLEIESVRFEWLVVDLDVPDELRTALVPAFTLQLLVENAVRHGLAPRGGGGRVHVAAQRDGGMLEIRVADDGVGVSSRTSSQSLGIGLANIRERLSQLFGEHAALELLDRQPQGAVVVVRMPARV